MEEIQRRINKTYFRPLHSFLLHKNISKYMSFSFSWRVESSTLRYSLYWHIVVCSSESCMPIIICCVSFTALVSISSADTSSIILCWYDFSFLSNSLALCLCFFFIESNATACSALRFSSDFKKHLLLLSCLCE